MDVDARPEVPNSSGHGPVIFGIDSRNRSLGGGSGGVKEHAKFIRHHRDWANGRAGGGIIKFSYIVNSIKPIIKLWRINNLCGFLEDNEDGSTFCSGPRLDGWFVLFLANLGRGGHFWRSHEIEMAAGWTKGFGPYLKITFAIMDHRERWCAGHQTVRKTAR